MMTVAQLVEVLKTYDPNLPVAYNCCSEQALMDPEDLEVKQLSAARRDGWIQNWRKDLPTQAYLVFPGN